MEVASLFNKWQVSSGEQKVFRLYFSWTSGRLIETLKALLQRLSFKTFQKWLLCYHLPWRFMMFINVFAFLHVKANSKEIVNKYLLLLFFRKMLMSAFLRFKANYLKKMRGYYHFSLWISIVLDKIYHFRVVLIWLKKSLYLVGTVLKMNKIMVKHQREI